eukprot:5449047-Prorocentrum_lima.AAC.1
MACLHHQILLDLVDLLEPSFLGSIGMNLPGSEGWLVHAVAIVCADGGGGGCGTQPLHCCLG